MKCTATARDIAIEAANKLEAMLPKSNEPDGSHKPLRVGDSVLDQYGNPVFVSSLRLASPTGSSYRPHELGAKVEQSATRTTAPGGGASNATTSGAGGKTGGTAPTADDHVKSGLPYATYGDAGGNGPGTQVISHCTTQSGGKPVRTYPRSGRTIMVVPDWVADALIKNGFPLHNGGEFWYGTYAFNQQGLDKMLATYVDEPDEESDENPI